MGLARARLAGCYQLRGRYVSSGRRPADAIVWDDFDRPDAGALGNAVSGQAWVALAGAPGVISGLARFTGAGGGVSGERGAHIDAGVADCEVSAIITVTVAGSRIRVRSSDLDNCILVEAETPAPVDIYRLQAGAFTNIGSWAGAISNGDLVMVRLMGSSIKLFVNGVERISATETFNQTVTKHGIGLWSGSPLTGRFDDFAVRRL